MGFDADDPSLPGAVEHLLQTARRHLGMEGAFLAELTDTQQLYRATAGSESFTILAGGELPRVESYCQYVMENAEPWVVRDAREDQRARRLAVTAAGEFGAYIGVPVILPDGRAFGTLCCLSHEARPDLGDRDVAVMEALADTLAFHLAELEERGRRLRELEDETDQLARTVRQAELGLGVLAEIVDASGIPTLVLDPASLDIDFANRAAVELLGLAAHQVPGSPPWELRREWTEESFRDRLGTLTEGGTDVVRFEEEPAEGWPALEVVAQRITSGAGEVILWVGFDITERREGERRREAALARERSAAEELRRLDRMRTAFLSAVSHELRTPLTAVLGGLETLRRFQLSAEQSAELLERVELNAGRLDQLLRDLLDLNRFAQGFAAVRREQCRLDDLVRRALEAVELPGTGPVLELEPLEAAVGPVEVERIVVNLLRNAAVHGGTGSPTHVRLSGTEGGALLVVVDQGPGIPAGERRAVFEPFWQGGTAPAHRPGMGIGLSLVAAFVELHGGRVWVEEAPGGGAAFHVWLPLAATGTATATPQGE